MGEVYLLFFFSEIRSFIKKVPHLTDLNHRPVHVDAHFSNVKMPSSSKSDVERETDKLTTKHSRACTLWDNHKCLYVCENIACHLAEIT